MERLTSDSFFISIDDIPILDKEKASSIDCIDRYNGGWAKEITGINREKTNGYSLLGGFVDNSKDGAYRVDINKLYMDCDIQGSRKNQTKIYSLFTIDMDGKITVLYQSDRYGDNKSTWVIKIWDICEKFLSNKIEKKEPPKKELAHLTSEELHQELIARGYYTQNSSTSKEFRRLEMY